MAYKYRPSKQQAQEYGQKMNEIRSFCQDHNIQHSMSFDSYYFSLNGKNYRVSNHSIAASNRGAFNEHFEQVREFYHDQDGRNDDTIEILAGKTRIIEIYTDLLAGYSLNSKGNRI